MAKSETKKTEVSAFLKRNNFISIYGIDGIQYTIRDYYGSIVIVEDNALYNVYGFKNVDDAYSIILDLKQRNKAGSNVLKSLKERNEILERENDQLLAQLVEMRIKLESIDGLAAMVRRKPQRGID